MALMLSKWYPPAKYIFMPMYRSYRRWFGTTKTACVALMATSGVLHLALVAFIGFLSGRSVIPALVFVAIAFGALTIAAACVRSKVRHVANN